MDTKRSSGTGIEAWFGVAAFAVAIGVIGWVLGARGGKRQYRALVKELDHLLVQTRRRTHEAQDLIQDVATDVTDSAKGASEDAQKMVKGLAKKSRRSRN